MERETVDLKPTNTAIQAAPRSNITCSYPAANAVLAATIRAGIRRLDHRPYLGSKPETAPDAAVQQPQRHNRHRRWSCAL